MMKYIYYEGANEDSTGLREKPKEKFKDFPDLIRYLVMAAPEYSAVQQRPEVPEKPKPNYGQEYET